jgi:hypothetical protein
MKRVGFSSIWLFVLLITGISLACENSAITSGTPSIDVAPSGSVAEQTIEKTEVINLHTEIPPTTTYLGDAVVQGGYYLIAVSVADPAPPAYFYTPEPGEKYLTVEVILGNISGESLASNPLNASLVDSNGIVYPSRPVGVQDQLPAADLFPGERIRGAIGFIISEKAEAATLVYDTYSLSGDYLKANLAPAPSNHTPVAVSITPKKPSSRRGDVVEQYGYSLTVTKVEDPSIPAVYIKVKNGYRMVAIEVVLGNVSQPEVLRVSPGAATLVDANGFVHREESDGRDGRLELVKLKIGETAKGWISFIIPENTTPLYLKYQTDIFEGNYLIAGVS